MLVGSVRACVRASCSDGAVPGCICWLIPSSEWWHVACPAQDKAGNAGGLC